MKKKSLLLLLCLAPHCFCFSQSVLDGVYVKEHVPVKIKSFSYPIPLKYEFDSLDRVTTIKNSLPGILNSLGKYPQFPGSTLVQYHIKEAAKTVDTLSTQNNDRLFERLFRAFAPGTRAESYEPPFLKFYLKSVSLRNPTDHPYFLLRTKPFLQEYFTPFYIKNNEVTNAEYREFVYAVRDSIARTLLLKAGIKKYIESTTVNNKIVDEIKWDVKIDWDGEEEKPVLREMYVPENQRYYRRRDIDQRKLYYTVHGKTLNTYPDTLAWEHQFPASTNNPMAIMYFWHPAYNDYPVVGLTYDQIEAYLDWKTKKENRILTQQHKNYRVEYRLPGEMQWELSSELQAAIEGPKFSHYLTRNADRSYRTQLILTCPTDTTHNNNDTLWQGEIFPETIDDMNGSTRLAFQDHIDWPHMAQLTKKGKYTGWNKVSGMHNNVSEYTGQKISRPYLELLTLRWKLMREWDNLSLSFILEQEQLYAEMGMQGEYLVRGGNWACRMLEPDGINAKCFVDGKTTYPTLGFRYTIYVHWLPQ